MTGLEPVRVEVDLIPSESGGLRGPLPSGTRQLIVNFGDELRLTDPSVVVGAEIHTADGRDLEPGVERVPATLDFPMAPIEGRAITARHDTFLLWAGRVVGTGRVVR